MAHKPKQTPQITCSHCKSASFIKNGWVQHKQRYKCKTCQKNFFFGTSPLPTTDVSSKSLSPQCFFHKIKKKRGTNYNSGKLQSLKSKIRRFFKII